MSVTSRLLFVLAAALLVTGCDDDDAANPTSAASGSVGSGGSGGWGGGGGSIGDGGAVTGGGGSDGSADVGEACAALAATMCGKLGRCTKMVEYVFGDLGICEERMALDCTIRADLPGTSATPAGFLSCAAVLDAASCDQFIDGGLGVDRCEVSPGALADGQECDDHAQCTSAYCDVSPGICGVCMARIPDGSDCSAAPFACDVGLACSSATSTCRPTGSAGQPCGGEAPCELALRCLGGTCEKPLSAGEACTGSFDCDGLSLLVCPDATSVCTELTLAAANEACGDLASGPTNCLGTSDCHTPGGDTGTCVPKASDGDACGTGGVKCMEPAECVDDVCKLPDEFTCN